MGANRGSKTVGGASRQSNIVGGAIRVSKKVGATMASNIVWEKAAEASR